MIIAIICLIIILVLIISYGVWMIYHLKQETKYPYYCTQPENARKNECHYLGFDSDCLCPYDGCNLQRNKDKRYY